MSTKTGKKEYMKSSASILFAISVLILFTGCSSLWEPSDQEAINLVESYYLFYQRGKAVDAEIVERNEFSRDCKCFPIIFRIIVPDQDSFEKKFYFVKNETGQIEVSGTEFRLRK